MSSPEPSFAERAVQYAEAVVAGAIPNGPYAVLACKRFLSDLDREDTEGFPYVFDPAKANRVCSYLSKLPHVEGDLAGQPLRLEDWQCFIHSNLYGWVRADTGKRRFQKAYLEMPRKQGKTLQAAGLGLYHLSADGEWGARVQCGATTKDQAREVFDAAQKMTRRTPKLREALGVKVLANAIVQTRTDSSFIPLAGNPGDGASVSFAIVDELHEAKTDRVLKTLEQGQGARSQPLLLVITTAGIGATEASPCYALRTDCVKILEGVVTDETVFALIYTVSNKDDWKSDRSILEANPNAGVSVSMDWLRRMRDQALRSPTEETTYKVKHLGIWTSAADAYFDSVKWGECKTEGLRIEDFAGEECWVGVDLASKLDLTARVAVFTRDGMPHVFAHFWLPEAQADAINSLPYRALAKAGWITLTPGDVFDQDYIEKDLKRLGENHQVKEFAYDQWNATPLAVKLQAEGLPMVQQSQSMKALSEPTKALQALIHSKRIRHDGNPILAWCISNVVCYIDPNDNVKAKKARNESKIDGAIALINALARQSVAPPPAKPLKPSVHFLSVVSN